MSSSYSGKKHWHYRHGMTKTRLYRMWKGIRYRCNAPTCKNYMNYGGRGIKVCNEWNNDYMAFYKWAIANGYDEKAPRGVCTIDRKNTDGDYCPENCRIVGMLEQENNRTNNHFVDYEGQRYTIAELSRKTGVKQRYISKHLLRGRDIYEIIKMYENRKAGYSGRWSERNKG